MLGRGGRGRDRARSYVGNNNKMIIRLQNMARRVHAYPPIQVACTRLMKSGALMYVVLFAALLIVIKVLTHSSGTPSDNLKLVRDMQHNENFGYSIVINTYKRPDMLKMAVSHYAETCGRPHGIREVYVVWAELNVPPPPVESLLEDINSHGVTPVKFLRVPKDSLNSRFLPIEGLATDNVFMVDDDVRVKCKDLLGGYLKWAMSRDALVGFYPRIASPALLSSSGHAELIYHTWPIVYVRNSFNIILTKACFLHKRYLSMYHDPVIHPKEILEYVDKNMNCEDVAMAMLVANYTRSARESTSGCLGCPVYVPGKVTDLGLFNGISTSSGGVSGHMGKRSKCVNTMRKIYEKHGWEFPLTTVPLPSGRLTMPNNFFEWISFGNLLK